MEVLADAGPGDVEEETSLESGDCPAGAGEGLVPGGGPAECLRDARPDDPDPARIDPQGPHRLLLRGLGDRQDPVGGPDRLLTGQVAPAEAGDAVVVVRDD